MSPAVYVLGAFVLGHVSMWLMMRIRSSRRRAKGFVDAEIIRMLRAKRERRQREARIAVYPIGISGSADVRRMAPAGAAKSGPGVPEPTGYSLRVER